MKYRYTKYTGEDLEGVDLEELMSKLSDLQQRIVRLRMLEELSGADVARELGLRPDHVATLLYRAKKELFRCVSAPRSSPTSEGGDTLP